MTTAPKQLRTMGRLPWLIALAALVVVGAVAAGIAFRGDTQIGAGPTVGEKAATLRAERASVQARVGSAGRIDLLQPLRVAGLLTDALALRFDQTPDRPLEQASAPQREALSELEAVNAALKDALARPGEGGQSVARRAAGRAQTALERLAGTDVAPLVLLISPRFVPPRQSTGELTVAPDGGRVRPLEAESVSPISPVVPRYAPTFAGAAAADPAVTIEVAGLHLAADGGPPPTLTIGAWRGDAEVTPERLRFSVPRGVFATDATRTTFVSASLALRRGARGAIFDLVFAVLPDRPGAFALDQRVRTMVPEANTLVSPEILARGEAGESRTTRRCFDPPAGWRFDKQRRRVVIVERLAWVDDIPDPTQNGGVVEFAADESPDRICVVVSAQPVGKTARTATIGRFEATLVRERADDSITQSGIRTLDWRERVRFVFDKSTVDWKLYIKLFDEIDREFNRESAATPISMPFLRISLDRDGKALVLQADPDAEP